MGQLLLGAPRRRGGVLPSQAERDRGQAVPGGELYLSFPGLGDRLAARIAGEIATIPNSSRRRTRCNAMPARPR